MSYDDKVRKIDNYYKNRSFKKDIMNSFDDINSLPEPIVKMQHEDYKKDLFAEQIKDRKFKRKLEEKNNDRIFYSMCFWCSFIGILTMLQGLKTPFGIIQTDVAVLMVLIGSATISIAVSFCATITGTFTK